MINNPHFETFLFLHTEIENLKKEFITSEPLGLEACNSHYVAVANYRTASTIMARRYDQINALLRIIEEQEYTIKNETPQQKFSERYKKTIKAALDKEVDKEALERKNKLIAKAVGDILQKELNDQLNSTKYTLMPIQPNSDDFRWIKSIKPPSL